MNTQGSYQNAYRQAAVRTMDQNKLIVMLYDGAIRQIRVALKHMGTGEIEKVHNSLLKSKNIISELMASLNLEKGGEIATNLQTLYTYMFGQLIESNMNKSSRPAEEVLQLLQQLRDAWVQIGQKPTTPQPSAAGVGNPAKRINLQG